MNITIDGKNYHLSPGGVPGISVPREMMTFETARGYASSRGLRLCTVDELHRLVREGTLPWAQGWSWTSTPAPTSLNVWTVCLESGSTTLRAPEGNWGRVVLLPGSDA